jgi:hypothetical protein
MDVAIKITRQGLQNRALRCMREDSTHKIWSAGRANSAGARPPCRSLLDMFAVCSRLRFASAIGMLVLKLLLESSLHQLVALHEKEARISMKSPVVFRVRGLVGFDLQLQTRRNRLPRTGSDVELRSNCDWAQVNWPVKTGLTADGAHGAATLLTIMHGQVRLDLPSKKLLDSSSTHFRSGFGFEAMQGRPSSGQWIGSLDGKKLRQQVEMPLLIEALPISN